MYLVPNKILFSKKSKKKIVEQIEYGFFKFNHTPTPCSNANLITGISENLFYNEKKNVFLLKT